MRILITALMLMTAATAARTQVIAPTAARDFWFGFMETTNLLSGQILVVNVGSAVNTSATLSVPGAGLSWTTPVYAGTQTAFLLTQAQVMPTGSEAALPLAIHVVADDPVTVAALNTHDYSSDASAIMPTATLGMHYRVLSYRGSALGDLKSELVIVPTADSTEVEIIPSAPTMGGQQAHVPFTVMLNTGELYPVKAAAATADLTGTKINVVADGGACKPVAVFSGTVCANIPTGCAACDHLYEQMWPSSLWGSEYLLVPFEGITAYAYRVMAVEDSTAINMNNNAPFYLDAGEWRDSLNVAGAICLRGDRPFLASQYMESYSCVGTGDPSLVLLTPADKKIQRIEFGPWSTSIIADNYVNIIVDTADIGALTIDGVPVATSDFSTFSACGSSAHTSQEVALGEHVIECPGGFTAYTYGVGQANTYAYAMNTSGVFRTVGDSVVCAEPGSTITLNAPPGLLDPYWVDLAAPEDTLAVGPELIVNVTGTDTYAVLTGDLQACGSFHYLIDPLPSATITDSLGVLSGPPGHTYQWYLNGSAIPGATDQTFEPLVNGTYALAITDTQGCSSLSADFIVLTVGIGPLFPDGLRFLSSGHAIEIHDPTLGVEEVQLYSPIGQLLQAGRISGGQGTIHTPVNASGVYVLRLRYHGNWIVHRLLVMEP